MPTGVAPQGFVENTLDAFAEARRLGADGVELDVRLTADGALAVHHDAEIPGRRRHRRTWAWPTCRPTSPSWPTSWPSATAMVVNVEIKNAPQDPGWDAGEAVAALTAAAIEEAGWTDRVIVSSFQVATLRAVQAADARLALGALWGFGADPGPGAWPRPPRRGSGRSTPSSLSVTPELVGRAHAAGLAVNVWTVNAPDDLRAMVALGVDAVITDRSTLHSPLHGRAA